MKRNQNLTELSKDHHHGLLLGWKIKTGLKKGVAPADVARYVTYFSTKALFPHFDAEENQVLTFLDEDDSYRRRTIAEHSEIKEMIKTISAPDFHDVELLLNLAHKVEAHIRFEERELFPYIETLLTNAQLEAIGKLIAEIHQPFSETYAHEFWAH